MILLYSEKPASRLKYTARLLFGSLLGLKIHFTNSREEYLQSDLPKINYSKEDLESGIYLHSSNLLFENDISDQDLQTSTYKDDLVIYPVIQRSDLPYDPLAAAFFLASRYEEYMPFLADEHNRFAARGCFMYKNNVLHLPLVNIYAGHVEELLLQHYPGLEFVKPEYTFINTVDIDNAYAYLGKGLFRTIGGFARDLWQLDLFEANQRLKTIMGLQKDPFETFQYQLGHQERYGYRTIYFALFANLGQYDRNLTMYSPRLQRYLKEINDFCEVGIHPSYRSNDHVDIAEKELHRLEQVLNRDITKSRQHFLKLKFPDTYRNLLKLEITDDYTMGYAAESGFRGGLCTPFQFYDLEMEMETNLTIHPFPFMDGTYIYYRKTPPPKALEEIKQYIQTYRKYGGEFIPVWHNRIFSEKEPEWKGWNNVFEEMVKAAI